MPRHAVPCCSTVVCYAVQTDWRNELALSPTQQYGGFSYQQVMLEPLADALKEAGVSGTRVWLTLQVSEVHWVVGIRRVGRWGLGTH